MKLLAEGDEGYAGVRDVFLPGARKVHPGVADWEGKKTSFAL